MSEIRAAEPLGKAIKRVATELIEEARERIRMEQDPDLLVHETRKSLKKLRALVRLVRDGLGESNYKEANTAFRDAGRLLSKARDRYVLRQTVGELEANYQDYLKVRVFRSLQRQLTKQHESEIQALEVGSPSWDAVLQVLEKMAGEVAEWPLNGSGFEVLESSIHRVYERGLRALEQVEDDPDPEKLHEWRKRVKYLCYQYGYLQQVWPMRMEQTEEALSTLADQLGKDHDLAVLSAWLDRGDPNADPVERVLVQVLIEQERQAIQQQALPLGRRLFAESPGAFTSRLRVYWDTMKDAPSP